MMPVITMGAMSWNAMDFQCRIIGNFKFPRKKFGQWYILQQQVQLLES